MSIRFERRSLGAEGDALLIIPTTALRVGRERLPSARLPLKPRASSIDDEIAAAAAPDDSVVRVSVFCGRAPDGSGGSWQFDEDLDKDEAYRLALHLLRSQLITMRRLFLAGVCMHVRIDFGGREQIAFRRATLDARRELQASVADLDGVDRELAQLDAWLLGNFVFFFAVSVDRLVDSTLGGNMHAIRQRIHRAARKRATLSAALLERVGA